MKKIVTSATVAALALSTVVAPSAMAEYKESFENNTCTIELTQADKDTVNEYLTKPKDSANNLATALQEILYKQHPEQKDNIALLEQYRANHPNDAILAGTLFAGGLKTEQAKQSLIKAVDGLTDTVGDVTVTFKGGDARWFVRGPQKTDADKAEFPATTLTMEQVDSILNSGKYGDAIPSYQALKTKIDKGYQKETGDLNTFIVGSFYSDSIKNLAKALGTSATKERDAAYKVLGNEPLKKSLENCKILSQGRDPEQVREDMGSSKDLEILRPLSYILAGVFGLFAVLGIAYGWVREHMPQLLGM
ncbi:hypothetical protein HMPREF1219_01613 [Corynebacterium pyruviciproducens ATCC BAA-1742]|uniref:Uncharacterized protein n=1 Tax=Corynebacterium pyruviciproducens ATCC BAA-1742 TaxID=1125779 RepID=S2ZEJ4_9CORY|nr:hypothetical protein [Corynebacterium pyruviciproducens]EPD68432.1 hypothetical protein HMPREF1219_01613 [Corynebacterium pyruviciproducens ATCC BAA-1742]